MRARSLVIAVVTLLAIGLAVPAVRRSLGFGGSSRVAAGTAADTVGPLPPDTLAAPADTGAAADSGRLPGDSQPSGRAADTAPARLPHPEIMLGTWHHGDARSRYGDSLVMVLAGNGSASAAERRWTLDASGWHVQRVRREGTWTLRYRGTARMDLCTEWVTPREAGSCERIVLTADSTLTDTLVMEYAGRHWRRVSQSTVREDDEDDARARRPRRAG